jgi:hypothetical protein
MDAELMGMIAAGVAVLPVYIWLLAKGVRSLSDIRDMFQRPPGDYGADSRNRDS